MTTDRKDTAFTIIWPPEPPPRVPPVPHPAGCSGDAEMAVCRPWGEYRFRVFNQTRGGNRTIPHLERCLRERIDAFHADGRNVGRTFQGVQNSTAGRGRTRACAERLERVVLRLAEKEAHRGCNLASSISRQSGSDSGSRA